MKTLVDKLSFGHSLTKSDWIELISSQTPELSEYVFAQAREVRDAVYGHEIYIRGLIEFTNYCRIVFVSHRTKSFPAVRSDTTSVFVPLCCRAERMVTLPMNV